MRNAYIGVSTPIGYDHSSTFRVGFGDADFPVEEPFYYNGLPYPTPILEAPYGLLLLYDELWFLSRALCPPDLQHLPYVKFIIETEHLSSISNVYVNYDSKPINEVVENHYFNLYQSHLDVIDVINNYLPINWNAKLSDQSVIFSVSNMPIFGFAGKLETLLIDLVFMSHIDIPGLELITNRFTVKMLEHLTYETSKHSNLSSAVEPILLNNIPNYLTQRGCYHPSIEEARSDQFLTDFRGWLDQFPKSVSHQEVIEIASDAQEAFRKIQNEIFIKYLAKSTHYWAVGKGLLNAGVDLLLPGVGTGLGALDAALEGRKTEKLRWLGFMSNQTIRANKRP